MSDEPKLGRYEAEGHTSIIAVDRDKWGIYYRLEYEEATPTQPRRLGHEEYDTFPVFRMVTEELTYVGEDN